MISNNSALTSGCPELSSPSTSRKFRTDINGLRAIALICVVAYHFGFSFLPGGFAGVDVFFVISGYLMTQMIVGRLTEGRFAFWQFFAARARRLVPALVTLCLVMLVLGWFLIDPLSYRSLSKDALSAVTFVSNFLFWKESNYFAEESGLRWLLHTWSLSVEWQFYIIYPIILALGARLFGTGLGLRALVLIGAVGSFALSVYLSPSNPNPSFFLLPTRAWEMLAGGLVYFAEERFTPSRLVSRILEALGLLLIGITVVLFTEQSLWPYASAGIPVLGAALVIFSRGNSLITPLAPMQRIGTWSYSLYLWHWPIAVGITYFGFGFTPVSIFVGIVLTLVLGIVSYTLIEQPARKTTTAPKWRARIVQFIGPGLVVVISAAGIFSSGFLFRAPNPTAVTMAEAAAADWHFPLDCSVLDGAGRLVPCVIGGASTGGTLVLGDSHAEQWYARAASLAGANDRIVFASSKGCLPLPGVNRLQAGYDCPGFFAQTEALLRDGGFDRVLIAAIWNIQEPGAAPALCLKDGAACVSTGDDHDVVAKGLAALKAVLETARAAGTEAVIVLPTPYGQVNVPSALAKAQFPQWNGGVPVAIDRAHFMQQTGWIRSQLTELAMSLSAQLVDPLPAMCSDTACPVLDADGAPLYMDSNHLRASYVSGKLAFLDQYLVGR